MSGWGSIAKDLRQNWMSCPSRPRARRSLKAKFARRLRALLKNPRTEVPRRQEALAGLRLPTFAAQPGFYRGLIEEIMSRLHNTPEKAGEVVRLALRLSPYVEDRCLAVDVWAWLAFRHVIRGRYSKAEQTLKVALGLGRSCPACVARLNRSLALLRRYQGDFAEALRWNRAALAFYEEGYDPDHDREDGYCLSLSQHGTIYYYSGKPGKAAHYFGKALSHVRPAESPELYDALLVNLPHCLAVSGTLEDLREVDRFLDRASGRLQGLPRYSVKREKFRWARWRIKFRLGIVTSKQVDRELRKARAVFLKERMGREAVVITTHIGEIDDVTHAEIRDLVVALGVRASGRLAVFPWIPIHLHERIRGIYRVACAWNWREYRKLPALLLELREAAGAGEIMPV